MCVRTPPLRIPILARYTPLFSLFNLPKPYIIHRTIKLECERRKAPDEASHLRGRGVQTRWRCVIRSPLFHNLTTHFLWIHRTNWHTRGQQDERPRLICEGVMHRRRRYVPRSLFFLISYSLSTPLRHETRGLFPAPISAEDIANDGDPKRTHIIRVIGQFVAKAMLDSRIIDMSFNKVFLKLALGEGVPLTIDSLKVCWPLGLCV